MNKVRSWLRAAVRSTISNVGAVPGVRHVLEQAADLGMQRVEPVTHAGITLRFVAPNSLTRFRAATFATKEPETLEWIDQIPKGSVLWDVGANVGLYSCYAAKARECRVVAFEPSVFNLELLARNLALNGLTGMTTVVPLPLSDSLGVNTLNMSTTEWGGALSTFGREYGQDGTPLNVVFQYSTVGVSMSDAVNRLGLPYPDYIKMDVDGIEHLILKGGGEVLRAVTGILIEINDAFAAQSTESARLLRDAGLTLQEKRHSKMFEGGTFKDSYNQIWRRASVA